MRAKITSTVAVFGLFILMVEPATSQSVSAAPTYGDVTLDAGFTPDPWTKELTAGGSIPVKKDGCSYGNVADAPDVDLYWDGNGGSLYIYVIASDDTTLLVNQPNATWICDDDSFGDRDPIVTVPKAEDGLYDIWVGTYGESMITATLYISEIDPREDDFASGRYLTISR